MKYSTKGNPFQLKSNHPPCIVDGCKKDTYGGARGLCPNHFSARSFQVKVGNTTWDKLIEEGRALTKLNKEDRAKIKASNNNLSRVWNQELGQFVYEKISST
jgi:hypothetical protein